MPDIQNISLHHLVLSPLNVRTVRTKEAVADLAANILAHNVLQNFIVHTQDEGLYGVVVGGSRLAALQLLLKQGKITEDYQVPCEVRAANDPALVEVSLSENVARSAMHPVDEFQAYRKLSEQGHGPEEIAARMGTTGRHVLQRLKLAKVNPKLITLVQKGEMSMDQLEAFTVSDDQKRQLKVWQELPEWARQRGDGDAIRNALVNQHIEADSKLATFITVESYEAAGGAVLRDLFDEEGTGWLTNADLVNRMVEEKLAAAAEIVRAEGWKWIQFAPSFSYEDTSKDGRLHPSRAEPSAEALAELEKLQAEADGVMEEFGEEPEDPEAYAKLEQLAERMDDIQRGDPIWTDEQKAASGAYVTIDQNGELAVRRGVVKPEDKAAARKLDGAAANVSGEKPAKVKGGLPASLIMELTSHKTVAAQLVLAENAPVALLAVTHAIAIRMFYDGYTDQHSSLLIKANEPTYSLSVRESVEKSAPGKKMAAVVKGWTKKLPKEPGQLWDWLSKQRKPVIESLLAVCVGMSVDLVQVNGSEAKASAGQLTAAIRLNMADHWQASAENYFTRVPKKLLLEELGTAVSATTKRSLEGMKRDVAAKTLTGELRGKKWLPPIMRAAKPGVV